MTNLGQIKWVNSTLIEFSNWIGNKYSLALIIALIKQTNKYSYSFKILNWVNPQ